MNGSTADRAAAIDRFVAGGDWRAARRIAMGGDASFRRYVRLIGGPRPALLMDAPPPMERVAPFVVIARHLASMGFSAPEIFQADETDGLLLIEDFGDDTFTRLLAHGADERNLYAGAIDVLIELHRRPDAAAVAVPAYGAQRLLDEALLLTDWYMPAIFGKPPDAEQRDQFIGIWRELFGALDGVPTSLVLRDYHVDNLMGLPGRIGSAACGLLDFQDGVIGSVAYDLVSLVEDARRDVPPALAEAMTARYLAAFPKLDRAAFAAAAAILAAQRNCKIVGIFTRLKKRDGKDAYLRHIPRVWRLLERDTRHPVLAPLRAWLDRHIPPASRRSPEFPA